MAHVNPSVMQIAGSPHVLPWTPLQLHCKWASGRSGSSEDRRGTSTARKIGSSGSGFYGMCYQFSSKLPSSREELNGLRNLKQSEIKSAEKSNEELTSGSSTNSGKTANNRIKTDSRPSWKDLIRSDETFKGGMGAATITFPKDREVLKKSSKLATPDEESFQKYFYHTDGGGQVVATVIKSTSKKYSLNIQVDAGYQDPLLLHWGLFRSNSTDWVLLDPKDAPPGTKYTKAKNEAMRTPLLQDSKGRQILKLDFDASKAPFYVAFVLFRPAQGDVLETWIRGAHGGNFCIPVGIGKGKPEPLGLTWEKDGSVNFSLYSKNATNVILCLYKEKSTQPAMEIDLDSCIHRTGDVWHAELESVGEFTRYGYRCKGDVSWESGNRYQARNVLLDPYAKVLAPIVPGQESLPSPALVLGSLKRDGVQFDWEGDVYPRIPLEQLVVYTLNVGSFTSDESSGLEEGIRGTFEGIERKVQHLVGLGVNAVVLEPIFEHDDCRFNPLSFFTPAARYAGYGLSASISLKKMVKELHRHGVEVILDVVYSHTAEGGDDSPKNISFRGIDNSTFYILDGFGKVVPSGSGTPNAFNCNHPVVQQMIVDSLRHWVEEYHIDGFVFMNGTGLVTGPHGQRLSRPVLVEAISFDPVLASSKLIVDTFSPFTRFSDSLSFPHWKRWCEWNISFRNDTRRFLRGDSGLLSRFATRLCGSGDIFASGRAPSFSMNYVTSPYGFTLADLVSFSESEGASTEFSWNCGAEGPTEDPFVLESRVKQVRNFIMAVLLSEGIPILNMGDEYGHSKGGQISLEESSSQFFWSYLESDFGKQISRLIKSLTDFRSRRKDLFQRTRYAVPGSITWHGADSQEPLWDAQTSSFLAARLFADKEQGGHDVADLYIAFNPQGDAVLASLPRCSEGMTWHRVADTSLPYPDDFVTEGVQITSSLIGTYEVQPYSSVILEARQRALVSRGKTALKFPAAVPSK